MIIRIILLGIVALAAAVAQNPNTARFPVNVLTDEYSAVAKDRSTSTLDASIDSDDLTVTVATGDGAKFAVGQIITIEDEQMQICGITGDDLTICPGTRGFYASGRGSWAVAVSHSNGVAVDGNYGAYHLNQVNAELKAIQTLLKANGAGVLRTDADSTTDAETTITFTPGATKPGAVFACGALPASPIAGSFHCNSAVSNHPYWHDGSTWYDLLQSFTGIANKGFERTGVNFSINQGTHGYDHPNLIVLLYDYDTGKRIDHPIYVQPVAPYAVTLDGDLPASRHMRVVISGWGGPSGSASPHDMLSATHQDTAGSDAPVLGGLIYANTTPAWAQLAGNTTSTPKVLRQTGTGSASAAPDWGQVTSSYVDTSIMTTGTITGFDAVLQDGYTYQQLYFEDAAHNMGVKNPGTFLQSVLNIGGQDNTGNLQNTFIASYVGTAASPAVTPYGNAVEGDVWIQTGSTGTYSKLAGVTGYGRADGGTNTILIGLNSQTSQRGPATTGTLAGIYQYALDVRDGTITDAFGLHIGGVSRTGGTINNSYGIYTTNAGGGTNNWNAYFDAGTVEVSANGTLRMTGPIEPGARVTGAKTLASASVYAFSVTPTLTTTGNADAYPSYFAPIVNTPNSAATGSIQGLRVQAPDITLGSGASLTTSMAVYIAGAATEAATNYALYVDGASDLSLFAGNLRLNGYFTTQTSFNAGVLNSLGAVGTPSYSFTGDTNTGLWSPTGDTLAWSTAGAERMRIDSAGLVGIGDTSPSAKLEIKDGTSGDQLRLGDGGSNVYKIGRNSSTGGLEISGTQVGYNFVGISGGLNVGAATDPGVGEAIFIGLKTTGAAGSKNVVCVDTATGKLYASSTGTDCSN